METRGIVIIFGSLAIIVSAIILGFSFTGTWAIVARVIGIVAGIAWFISLFYLASAMNTDI